MYYMGVDVGSVSTDIVLLDEKLNVAEKIYLRTKGKPIQVIQEGIKILQRKYKKDDIKGVGTTGSGRHIAATLLGADVVKNEITAHAIASLNVNRNVRTIIEIGGQDSKIITLKDGIITDFAMNTVCAAGTGSFLDRQAERLEIPIEEFGNYALKSDVAVRIAGRCAVFAESDMIHKQQLGYNQSDIIKGLCMALVRNYLNNVGKGKEIKPEIFFQGGVAANKGIKKAFENELGYKVYVPKNYDVMGAIGVAIMVSELEDFNKTKFKGFQIGNSTIISKSFECSGCSNRCEVVNIRDNLKIIGCFGDKCGKWSENI
ncbi:2-hydroxyglutaryl-CoA dehydratase [Clostridium novyi B str. ATCC 27606]|uniref:Activator of 2-hydroxyglutaryl-CoA dehydratase n=3 Tax=Clostridium TaxID=1485 RepID=A0A9P2G914_CLOBO|nr:MULTISPECIES: acyl-CoA dehydratase activase [Clostridium]AYF54091.1 2-hydroxyglutaryl-CoA dehydratase [Clostridium novyi]EES92225.1 activator of 2-hydroxyglutaryl-CoA dehydratase [Clostridium botulinum D str. 1873]KEI13222.1 2-hydroxyglutaryl-CoA dehydratase [Clostridium novyi B str. NCTC 9691]KEI16813.1 2-hydroxyglutaryl-CoA dehydratase [Clostridium haemolyticum NCTC 9693]KEI17113.1 2-hydroxyglutaryl-CoA dehydratase [Clostridium novyi B str. ATCC 27606]